jgi:hypothetical protein
MRAKLLAIKIELRRIMHDPIAKTGTWVKQMLKGHLNYFAVSGVACAVQRRRFPVGASPTRQPLQPLAQRRQSPARPDQAHRQRHRPPGLDYPRPNSRLTARETGWSDCGHRQRQSASSNPPAESPENHITERVFTQSGPISDISMAFQYPCLNGYDGCQPEPTLNSRRSRPSQTLLRCDVRHIE